MFFRSLHAVARHTPLHIIVTPNGEQLRLIVTPKPSGEAADNPALAKPFTAIGTPEELDAELPEVLRKYTESVNDLRARLDLPLDELEAAKAKAAKKDEKKAERERQKKEEEERRSEAAKKAAETRAANAAKAKEEKARKAKERADAKAAKKAAKAGTGIQLPGATAPAAAEKAAQEAAAADAAKHLPNLPGKPECIRDYQQLKAKHGDKLTRRLFIKRAETGRRYEKLWKNWEKFVKEASAQPDLPLEEPNSAPASSGAASDSSSKGGTTPAAEPNTRAADSAAASGAASGSSPDARSNDGKPAARTIPIAEAKAAAVDAAPAAKCDGCKHIVYSAPGGQLPLKPFPHSRCGKLDVDVPMIIGEQGKWLSSLIPPGCPFHEPARPVKGKSPGPFTDVYDEAGTYLSSITTAPEVGKHIGLVSQKDLLRIVTIEKRPSGGLDVTVVPDPEFTHAQAASVMEAVREQNQQNKKSEAAAGAVSPPPGQSTSAADLPAESAPAPASETRPNEPAWAVFDEKGMTIAYTRDVYKVGDRFDIGRAMLAPDFKPDSEERLVQEVHVHSRAYTVKSAKPKYQVVDEETGEIVAEFKWPPSVGEKLSSAERPDRYRVLSLAGHRVNARRLLPAKKMLLDDAGNPLGHSDEIYDVTDQVAEIADKEWRVLRIEENAYILKAAKPRIKGPTAAATIVTE